MGERVIISRRIVIAVLTAIYSTALSAQGPLDGDASARCKALQSVDFSAIADAPTQITAATAVDPSADTAGYCQVTGHVAPSVGFLLRLPTEHWNGKFIELGCGSACGSTDHIVGCDGPLRRGYACIVSDGGHRASSIDMRWAYNQPNAVITYLVHASHLTALAGKAVTERYYGGAPRHSYFMGCSAGGLQAMWEAQKFPSDFTGIVAGAPDLNLTGVLQNALWAHRALRGEDGKPILSNNELDLLHAAVVAECDLNDGVADGVIGDPRACHFEPTMLRCRPDKKSHCLTQRQIDAVTKVYGGPMTSSGEQIVLPSALKGSEQKWAQAFTNAAGEPNILIHYLADWIRYAAFQPNPGSGWQPEELNFDRDPKRFGFAAVWEPVNPDLRELKRTGAKLLMYTGWNDVLEGVLRTVDYYETAEKVMGSRAQTQDFFRLFVIPGMDHCLGGDGAHAVDYLSYLEAWVEEGKAPEKLIGHHVTLGDVIGKATQGDPDAMRTLRRRMEFPLDPATVEFSRPIYPYPIETKYRGHGDANSAENFVPVQRASLDRR